MRVSFVDPQTGHEIQIPDTTINFVPLAIEAQSVSGFNAKNLMRVVNDDGTGTPEVVNALTKSQYDTLLDWLMNGLPSGGGGGGTGGVTEVTAQSPLSVTNGMTTPQISISQAGPTSDGYLTSADWSLFNSKQPAGNYITELTGDVVATGPGSAVATIQSGAVTYDKIQNVTSGRLLGRFSGSDGPIEEIQIGSQQ